MCVLLHLLICTALRAHIIVVEALYKINYYYYYYHRRYYVSHNIRVNVWESSVKKSAESIRLERSEMVSNKSQRLTSYSKVTSPSYLLLTYHEYYVGGVVVCLFVCFVCVRVCVFFFFFMTLIHMRLTSPS